jgi:hypothetical protein
MSVASCYVVAAASLNMAQNSRVPLPLARYRPEQKYTSTLRPLIGRRGRSGGHHEPAGRPGAGHRPEATPDHHRRLGARRAVAVPRITRSVGSSRRARSCLTRADHRPVVWPHEIPDSGISHRSTESSPCSGTEEGDISPVSAALEHAAGDFTTLGTDPSLECSSLGHVKSP